MTNCHLWKFNRNKLFFITTDNLTSYIASIYQPYIMKRILLIPLCLIIFNFNFSQNHEVAKVAKDFTPKSLLRLSDGNAVVTGFAATVAFQNYNYKHIGALIDSNGHLIRSQFLPYASLNLFEHENNIYNMWTDECVCVDCGLYIGDVRSSVYDLNMIIGLPI